MLVAAERSEAAVGGTETRRPQVATTERRGHRQATGRMVVDADKNGLIDLPGVGSVVVGSRPGGAPVGLGQPTITEASAR